MSSKPPDRSDFNRNAIVFSWTAPAAVICWLVFHALYWNLSVTAAAVGEIDAGTKMGIAFGYIAMVGGTAIFAVLALVAGTRALRIWLRDRRSS
ncbi:MAG TPA: hypothetical protein VMH02_05750 [Verrucomicrobiae bacterium]|nr:hypothetical protein [Verrucomicrobiae bacterium]